MPIAIPPAYLDVPAIIEVSSRSFGIHMGATPAPSLSHFGNPIARPLGSSNSPDSTTPLPPVPQPQTSGADAKR
jgi:hypothetical protein